MHFHLLIKMYLTLALLRSSSKSGCLYKNSLLLSSRFPVLSQNFNASAILQQSSRPTERTLSLRMKKYLKHFGIFIGSCSLATGVYFYLKNDRKNFSVANSFETNKYLLEELPPKQKIAHSVQVPEGQTGIKITLYQYQTCPFCCKVKSFLDYYGFSYDVIEVNPLTRRQTKWSSYKKVPFLVVEQEGSQKVLQLKDSSMIISALQSYRYNKSEKFEELVKSYDIISYTTNDGSIKTDILNRYSVLYGQQHPTMTEEQIVKEKKWRKWVDDVYVHMLSPNIYRTMSESLEAFSWYSKAGKWDELFGAWQHFLAVYVGAFSMYVIGKRLKKRHHLKDDVRLSLYEETKFWLKEVKTEGGKFAGGDKPNLSDLEVYGVLTAVEGCDAFQDLIKNTKVQPWFIRMKEAVETHQGVKSPG